MAVFNLALVVGQLGLFLPDVAAGRAVDSGAYRVDGLGLVFGVAWCVAAALVAWAMRGWGIRAWVVFGAVCLVSVAGLNMAYAREPLLLYVAWEVAGLGLWLMARYLSGMSLRAPAWALHIAGWPLLVVIVLGLVPAFAPPFGGEAQAWPAWVCVILGVTALMRGGVWPFGGWTRIMQGSTGGRISFMLALYALLASFVLAKVLVAAPWEALGGWSLVLVGTLGLLGSAGVVLARGSSVQGFVAAVTSAAVIGLGLAPGSPLGAAGALALMVVGFLSVTMFEAGAWGRSACMAGTLLGAWLITQAAISQGYVIVAGLLLLALTLIILYPKPSYQLSAISYQVWATSRTLATNSQEFASSSAAGSYLPAALLIILAALYPQALYWVALRPAVGAMAGGVAAPGQLVVDWGVGLRVEAAGGVLLAALPATGIAVALFLAWATLYWLRRIASRFYTGDSEAELEQEAG